MGGLTKTVSPSIASFTATAGAAGTNRITLTWSVRDAQGTTSSSITGDGTATTSANSYVFSNLTPGQFYSYSLRVTDARGLTSVAASASATVPEVVQSGTQVSWTIPTQNADGTPLTDLAGFYIYYGQDAENLNFRTTVANPAATSASVPNLSSGTWYFSVTAYDTDGNESYVASRISKVVS